MDKPENTNTNEISFKDLLKLVISFGLFARKNWLKIFFTGMLGLIIFSINSVSKKPEYIANLSFMINQDNSINPGSLGNILGNFGFGSKGKDNPSRILKLARSKSIIQRSLQDSVIVNDSSDLLANHLMEHFDTTGQLKMYPWYMFWKSAEDTLHSFRFGETFESDDEYSQLVLKILYEIIAGKPQSDVFGMMKNGIDEESRIMYLQISSKNPGLSVALTNQLFDDLSTFYIEKSVEKQKTTYDILKHKTDSLSNLLHAKENRLAGIIDSGLGRYSSSSKVKQKRLNSEVRLLNIALGEAIKNLEIADFALKNTTPYIQVIDRPEEPLTPKKPSLIKKAIIGFLFGSILAILYLILRKSIAISLED